MSARAATLVVLAVSVASCATRVFTRPSGAGAPAPDALAIWAAVSARCATVDNDFPTLELRGGRFGGRQVPTVTILGALTADGGVHLSARYRSQGLFVLKGTAERALLELTVDAHEYVIAPAVDIVDALIGVRVTPAMLLTILTGCATAPGPATGGVRYDRLLAVDLPDARVYLESRGGVWRVAARDLEGLRVDYPKYAGEWPRDVLMEPAGDPSATLRLRVLEHNLNYQPVEPALFAVAAPAGAREITMADLRARIGREGR
jgi:hypothetical protein